MEISPSKQARDYVELYSTCANPPTSPGKDLIPNALMPLLPRMAFEPVRLAPPAPPGPSGAGPCVVVVQGAGLLKAALMAPCRGSVLTPISTAYLVVISGVRLLP